MFATTESSVGQAGQTRVQDATTLVINRWSRYGKRRLYVNTADGQQVGWVDLDSGERVLSVPALADVFTAAVDGMVGGRSEPYSPRRLVEGPEFMSQPRRAVAVPSSELAAGSQGAERDPGVRRDDAERPDHREPQPNGERPDHKEPQPNGERRGKELQPNVQREDDRERREGRPRPAHVTPEPLRDGEERESRSPDAVPGSLRSERDPGVRREDGRGPGSRDDKGRPDNGGRQDDGGCRSGGGSGEPWTDLAGNVPGQAARARARQELVELRERKGTFITFLARGLDAKTDERSWRIGADGEETVGARLEKLRTHGWRLLHSVPVGKRDSDIDHVLIGPGGVFTINTKTHPKANIWVGRTTVMVNGHRQPYLRNSRFEADRAAKLLSRTVGWDVEVTPALVFLTDTFIPNVTIKDRPDDVLILDRLDLPRYFRRCAPVLTTAQVEQLFDKARRSTTWR